MPHSTHWEPDGVVWRAWGQATPQQLMQLNREAYGDPRFSSLRYQICDFLDLESTDATTDEIRQMAELDLEASKVNPHMKVAIVSDRAVVRGYVNMYAAFADTIPWEIEFFDTMEEARDWIATPMKPAGQDTPEPTSSY